MPAQVSRAHDLLTIPPFTANVVNIGGSYIVATVALNEQTAPFTIKFPVTLSDESIIPVIRWTANGKYVRRRLTNTPVFLALEPYKGETIVPGAVIEFWSGTYPPSGVLASSWVFELGTLKQPGFGTNTTKSAQIVETLNFPFF